MEGMAALGGTLGVIWAIFLLIVAILALLMPFFILRIRKETIEMNKKMSVIIDLLNTSTDGNEAQF